MVQPELNAADRALCTRDALSAFVCRLRLCCWSTSTIVGRKQIGKRAKPRHWRGNDCGRRLKKSALYAPLASVHQAFVCRARCVQEPRGNFCDVNLCA